MASAVAAKYLAKGATQAAASGVASSYLSGKGVRKAKPGEHWSNPIDKQHPDLSSGSRFFLNTFEAATPETFGRALAKKFDVKHRGGLNFSIRKPGEKKWMVVDPKSWTDWIPFYGSDWSDIIGDMVTGVLSGVAGTAAATATSLTGPAALGVGSAAAGGTAMAVEGAKQALGKFLGSGVTMGEAAESVVTEGALGALAEPIAQVAGPAIKGGLKSAKTALLGNVDEIAEANVKQAVQARAAGTPEFPMKSQEGLLPKITKIGTQSADDIALHEVDSVAQLLDLPQGELRSRAAKQGVKLSDDTPIEDVTEALTKKASQDLAGEVRRLKGEISRAQNIQSRTLTKQLKADMVAQNPNLASMKPAARNTAIRRMILESVPSLEKQLAAAEKAVTKGPASVYDAAKGIQQGLAKGEKEALEEASRLGVKAPAKLPGTLAGDVFEAKTTDTQKEALGRQIDKKMSELGDFEPMELSHILKNESTATGLPPGAERTYKGTKKPKFNAEAYREATDELSGLRLDQAQDLLQRSGYTGKVPGTIEEITDKLYARKHLGLVGGESVSKSDAIVDPLFDPETHTPWHGARKDLVTGITAGGKSFRPEGGKTMLGGIAKATQPWAEVAGGAMAGVGEVMQLPAKAVRGLAGKVLGERGKDYAGRKLLLGGVGIGAGIMSPAVIGTAAAGYGIDLLGRGVASWGRKLAEDGSGEMLIRLASSAPEKVAAKLWPAIDKLERLGVKAYRAALFSIMHDPSVRYWLRQQNLNEEDR